MKHVLILNLLRLLIILPLIILFIQNHNKTNYLRIAVFIIAFLGYQIVESLPGLYNTINFINSNWNWDGKLLGVVFGMLCFFLFRNYFKEHNYFTLKQDKNNIKKTSWVAFGLVVFATIVWYVLGNSDFDSETLLFQLTLPGIDEEIMYRGILLGLLMSSTKNKITNIIGSPAVLITSILFGLIHAFTLSKDYSINFNVIYFIQTGFAGYIWGWVTIKSKSILLAILSHNFSNFFGTLATMIK